jgi:hypothetical protein
VRGKEAYLEHLATAPPEVVRVSLADKLHNARAIVFDFRRLVEELLTRFDPASDQLWTTGRRSMCTGAFRTAHSATSSRGS